MAYTKDIGLKDFYNYYKDFCKKKEIKPKDYKIFRDVIKLCNSKLQTKIVYESERVKLPGRLGDLYIKKYPIVYNIDMKHLWKVDYIATKQTGRVVYFENDYGYKWKWYKTTCIIKGKRYYQFKPCRKASRNIADAIKNKKLDYYS